MAPSPAKVLLSIAVSPGTDSLQPGAGVQFSATGSYSDGSTADITSSATWSVSSTAIATVSSSGMVTAVSTGSTRVTASANGVSGQATLTVDPAPKTLSSIAISPSTPSIVAGATQQFVATGTYSDGSTADVTATVTWSTSSTAVATINSAGLALGVAAGTTSVTATLSGVASTANLTVAAPVVTPTLSSIAITPATASILTGGTQQFKATGTYSDGSTADVTGTATWATGSAAVATINGAGLASGVAAGSTSVTATVNGVTGTASLTVDAPVVTPTLSSIAITPATASIAAGATQQFKATGTYSDGSTADVTGTATWATGSAAVATINGAGLASGVAAGTTSVTATVNGVTGTASLTVTAAVVTPTLSSIAVTPATASIAAGATQQFTATATYSDGSTADISSSATWTAASAAIATVNSTGLATGVAAGATTISAAVNGVSGKASLSVTPVNPVSVTTWHFDNNRSGLNPTEQSLNPANVNATSFGKLFSYQLDGYMYAEPLLVSGLTVNGAKHNVVFAATENDSVYAFDADSYGSGAPLWHVSLLQSGETPITSGPIKPVEGITSTPVIDPATNTLYVVSAQKGANGGTFRLNALDLATGAHKFGSPVAISASVPGTSSVAVNGTITLTTACIQRAALLLANGNIYMGFGSCPTGWLLAYDASNLTQVGVFNASPNMAGEGTYASAGGVWMGSGGPVADSSGNVYVVTGNGPWDGKTAWGDSVLKFNAKLQLLDSFTPDAYAYMNCADSDFAAGGLMMIPGTSQLLAGGKVGKMFLLDSTNLGGEATGDTGAVQTVWFDQGLISPYSSTCTDSAGDHTTLISPYEIFGTAAYYNGAVYMGVTPTGSNVPSGLREFTYNGTLTPGANASDNVQQNTRGTTPFISSNGAADGIAWMIDTGQPIQNSGGNAPTHATLRAYDASHFPAELYNSSTNAADVPGYGIKFTSPVVANGKVYVSTGHDTTQAGELDVYGLK